MSYIDRMPKLRWLVVKHKLHLKEIVLNKLNKIDLAPDEPQREGRVAMLYKQINLEASNRSLSKPAQTGGWNGG